MVSEPAFERGVACAVGKYVAMVLTAPEAPATPFPLLEKLVANIKAFEAAKAKPEEP